jgi:hypothetical protein
VAAPDVTSLRKLNRRLRTWQRYTSRYPDSTPAKGHGRAVLAVALEQDSRDLSAYYDDDLAAGPGFVIDFPAWHDDEGPW